MRYIPCIDQTNTRILISYPDSRKLIKDGLASRKSDPNGMKYIELTGLIDELPEIYRQIFRL